MQLSSAESKQHKDPANQTGSKLWIESVASINKSSESSELTIQNMARSNYQQFINTAKQFLLHQQYSHLNNTTATTISNIQQSKFHQMEMKKQNQSKLGRKKYQRSEDQQQFFIQQNGKHQAIKVSPDEDGDEKPI